MDGQVLLVEWRDLWYAIAWVVAVVFLLSGAEDLMYDIVSVYWRMEKRIRFRKRHRLTAAKMRLREQQSIAVMVPAWDEGDVVGKMVTNIIERVEYRNYHIFVGMYPNDERTVKAVNGLSAMHPNIHGVVLPHDGPTNKADCLNHIHRAIVALEEASGKAFNIVIMHDAEDVVHPYSFMLYNYLIPRVDAVQLPILPLPQPHRRVVHWLYADEFAENHLKDIIARERIGGFVPFAGVGTAFSRRALTILGNARGEDLFNTATLTEDYSLSLAMRLAGLKTVFVNLLLADDRNPWFKPLSKRSDFISNWSIFPTDFKRSVRQKTRWILGISLQEWEFSGWDKRIRVAENLVKDRKVFVSMAVAFLGYLVFIYQFVWWLGTRGAVPFQWLNLWERGTVLYWLILIDTCLMILRLLQRFAYVGMVYGPVAGFLAMPRTVLSNVVNGLAAYRALAQYIRYRRGKARLAWDKTQHVEGVGELPSDPASGLRGALGAADQVAAALDPDDGGDVCAITGDSLPLTMKGLERVAADPRGLAGLLAYLGCIPRDLPGPERGRAAFILMGLAAIGDTDAKGMAARIMGFLRWPELTDALIGLLYDPEWVVRANAATALVKFEGLPGVLEKVFARPDRYAWQVLIGSLEQDSQCLRRLEPALSEEGMKAVRDVLLNESRVVRNMAANANANGTG